MTPVFLVVFIPDLLVIAGLVTAFAFVMARRNTLGAKASGFAAIGIALLIVVEFAGAVWNTFVLRMLLPEMGPMRMAPMLSAYALLSKLAWALGIGLVITAVFADRPRRTAR